MAKDACALSSDYAHTHKFVRCTSRNGENFIPASEKNLNLKASWPLTISLLWPLAATDTQIVCSNRIILLAHCQ